MIFSFLFLVGNETCFYYGPLNLGFFNAEYRNKHQFHNSLAQDCLKSEKFPRILQQFSIPPVRYFITEPAIGSYTRMKRIGFSEKQNVF